MRTPEEIANNCLLGSPREEVLELVRSIQAEAEIATYKKAAEIVRAQGCHSIGQIPRAVKALLSAAQKIEKGEAKKEFGKPGYCHADRDGDCEHSECPQLRDCEPAKSGRSCPLKRHEDEES